MKTFKEMAVNELKIDNKSYTKFSAEAIKNINMMIEYGRKTVGLDNKQLNPLLDAIKNIHGGEDAIRKVLEDQEKPEEKDDKNKKEKGDKQW